MDVWGFNYTRRREVVWWLMVAKHCFKADRFLVRYIAQFVAYEIRLDFEISLFSYTRSYSQSWHIIILQRDVIASWMKNKKTLRSLPRRFGKTTIIQELVNIIPVGLSVLVIVISVRIMHQFEELGAIVCTPLQLEHMLALYRFDFIFAENVDVEIPETDARVLILK